jgi:hypothetical protein
MHNHTIRSFRVCVALAGLTLAGCTFRIVEPASGAVLKNPVQAEIDWTPAYQASTFKVIVDPTTANRDVTQDFTIGPLSGGGYAAKGALTGLANGTHTLKVSGDLYMWLYGGYKSTDSQVSFGISQPKK